MQRGRSCRNARSVGNAERVRQERLDHPEGQLVEPEVNTEDGFRYPLPGNHVVSLDPDVGGYHACWSVKLPLVADVSSVNLAVELHRQFVEGG